MHHVEQLDAAFRQRYSTLSLDTPAPAMAAIRQRQTMVIGDLARVEERLAAVADIRAAGLQAVIAVPLIDTLQKVIGVLITAWAEPRDVAPVEVELVEAMARMAAKKIERLQANDAQREIAHALQDHLLGLDSSSTCAVVAAGYVAALDGLDVGGDWYKTIDLGGAALGVAVGDVVGKGLEAAAVMGQLRSALGMAALLDRDPRVVVDHLDRFAHHVVGAACSTASYVVIDNETRTIRHHSAGHPYPLLVNDNGELRYLHDGRRPPLASRVAHEPCSSGIDPFPAGSLLLLYTDGLIERRGESLDIGFDRLARAAISIASLPAAQVCDHLLTQLRPEGGFPDDAVVVAVRAVGATAHSFVAVIHAEPGELSDLRVAITDWLSSIGLNQTAVHDIRLAVGEAINNAIVHGSRDPTSTIRIEAFLDPSDGERLSVHITDCGHWAKDSSASARVGAGGRGLKLMHALMDDVEVRRDRTGTCVTLRHTVRAGAPQ